MKTHFQYKTIGVFILMLLMSIGGFAQNSHKPNDAEIASVAVVANQVDIDFAKFAIDKSTNPEVQEFAKTMIADHNAIINMASDLVTKLGVVPQDNKMSRSILMQAEGTIQMFHSISGEEFDKEYINNEVQYHKDVIQVLKEILIPQTENAELKKLLETALPILEIHLMHAEMAQKSILKK